MTRPDHIGESDTRRAGRVHRIKITRDAAARCLQCDRVFVGADALAAGTRHSVDAGHVVKGQYFADYVYVPVGAPAQVTGQERLRSLIIDFLGRSPGASRSAIVREVRARHAAVLEALGELVTEGHVVIVSGPRNARRHYLAERTVST
jgi:hypothetical protein